MNGFTHQTGPEGAVCQKPFLFNGLRHQTRVGRNLASTPVQTRAARIDFNPNCPIPSRNRQPPSCVESNQRIVSPAVLEVPVVNNLPQPTLSAIPARPKSPRWLQMGFWICVVIAAAAALRRIFALAAPAQGGPPQMIGLDQTFAAHAGLTLAHIIPAILFVLLAPLVVFSRFARLRWPERILFPLGAIVGLTWDPLESTCRHASLSIL